jgi:hypothetical protein
LERATSALTLSWDPDTAVDTSRPHQSRNRRGSGMDSGRYRSLASQKSMLSLFGAGEKQLRNQIVNAVKARAASRKEEDDEETSMNSWCGYHTIWRRKIRDLVARNSFDLTVGAVIFLNSIYIGVETEYCATNLTTTLPTGFKVVEYTFTTFFCFELAMRIAGSGWYSYFFGNGMGWAWFDGVIVATAIADIIIAELLPLLLIGTDMGGISVSQMRVVRIVRVTRLLRILRISRIVRYVAALRTLLLSMFHTGGISWHDATKQLAVISGALEWLFVLYIGFTVFAVLNVVTGVFCNTAIEAAQRDPEIIADSLSTNKQAQLDQMVELFEALDLDKSGNISLEELGALVNDFNIQTKLASLNLDVNDAWTLFSLIDRDKQNVIEIEEFVAGCMQLKGANKQIDMLKMIYDVRAVLKKIALQVDTLCQPSGRSPSIAAGDRYSTP